MIRPRSLARALPRDDRGTTAAEFALVVPVFLTLIFGTISTCLLMSAVNNIHYAAERTARCQAVNVSGSCTDADTYAKSVYSGPSVTGLSFVASTQTCGLRVIGTGSYTFFPGVDMSAVSISAQACYPKPT